MAGVVRTNVLTDSGLPWRSKVFRGSARDPSISGPNCRAMPQFVDVPAQFQYRYTRLQRSHLESVSETGFYRNNQDDDRQSGAERLYARNQNGRLILPANTPR